MRGKLNVASIAPCLGVLRDSEPRVNQHLISDIWFQAKDSRMVNT